MSDDVTPKRHVEKTRDDSSDLSGPHDGDFVGRKRTCYDSLVIIGSTGITRHSRIQSRHDFRAAALRSSHHTLDLGDDNAGECRTDQSDVEKLAPRL